MWIVSPLAFGLARWLGSLIVWFAAVARRGCARMQRCREPRAVLRERERRAAPRDRDRRDDRCEGAARPRPTVLAVAAMVSSEAIDTPRIVTVPAQVGPTDIELALSLLHEPRGVWVLNLSAAPSAPFEHCKVVAASWPSRPATRTPYTRLAILVKFEHWAIMRGLITAELALLATKGVEALLCYEEQRWDQWFLAGAIVHDVPRVLSTLSVLVERQRAHGTDALTPSHWRFVLAAAVSLLDGSPPETLCELARIAFACGANEQALDFANEAVRVAPKASVLECRALRLVGVAMMRQGLSSGVQALEDALDLAVSLGATREAAAALNDLGLHELKRGERHAAESRLQAAVALCPSEYAELWTALRDVLAQTPPN